MLLQLFPMSLVMIEEKKKCEDEKEKIEFDYREEHKDESPSEGDLLYS